MRGEQTSDITQPPYTELHDRSLHCELMFEVYLCEGGHSQQRVLCDGMISQVRRRTQRFNTADFSFRATEETARVARTHPHHSPVNKKHMLCMKLQGTFYFFIKALMILFIRFSYISPPNL